MKKITGKQKTKTSISLKTMLTGFIVLTISFTTAIVYFPWFFTSKKNIDKIVTQINEEIALSTSKEFTDLFQNVYYTQDFIRSAINRNIVNINNPEERDRFFLSILQSNPDFSFVQFAYPNGDYVGAQRVTTAFEKQNTFKLHFRQWDEERKLAIKTTDQYELIGQKLQLIKTTQIEEPNWYTPGRPWYRDALKTPGQAAWTVYVYRSTNTPGIDSNIALYKEQTDNIYWRVENPSVLLGVIGVGFEFRQISQRLQEQQKGRSNIEVFVINSQGEMIASTDPNEHSPIQIKGQDQPQLQLLKNSKNPYFQMAVKILEERAIDLKLFSSPQQWISKNPQNGKYYYVSLTRAVTPMNQLHWFIGTVIPEDQYMGTIKKNNKILLGFVIILILGTTTMRERLEELNQRRIQRGEVTIQAGIGISSGEVVAGQIGSLERLLYTVIGDAVNVAARLETLTKEYPEYAILINESTAVAIEEHHGIVLKSLGEIKVKGRQKSVEVYAVLDWKKEEILVVTSV